MKHPDIWQKEHPLVVADLENIAADSVIPWGRLSGSRILITGATGLIGTLLVKALLYYADSRNFHYTIIALTRNKEKGTHHFSAYAPMVQEGLLEIAEGDVVSDLAASLAPNYILHAAAITNSAEMINNPVGTIATTMDGTRNILNLARKCSCRSVLFLSSMEVYGRTDHELVTEDDCGYLNLSSIRNCYPLSKRLAENLCVSHCSQFGTPVKIARLTLTFGPGIPKTDNRVFAQFAHSVMSGSDIVLHTQGTTKRDYLYTADAVRALLTILLCGKNAEAYNVSDPDSYITIRELAEITRSFRPEVKVLIQANEQQAKKYAQEVHIQLDNSKFDALNPFRRTHVREMVERLLNYLQSL